MPKSRNRSRDAKKRAAKKRANKERIARMSVKTAKESKDILDLNEQLRR